METPEQFDPAEPQRPATLAVPPETPAVQSPPPQPAVTSGGEDRPSSEPSSAMGRWASVPHRLDLLLAGSVLLLAFLAASFIAVNSDFWLHLAAGKLLA